MTSIKIKKSFLDRFGNVKPDESPKLNNKPFANLKEMIKAKEKAENK